MIYQLVRRLGIAAAAAVALSGCSSYGERMWVAQGPGDLLPGRAAPVHPRPKPSVAQAAVPAGAAARPEIASAGGYTQATRYGDLLFISGQIAQDLATNTFSDSANIEQQTRTVMENIQRLLEAHRLTMANVVSVTVYLKSLNDFRGMDTAYESFFRSNLPARSVVEVSRLPRNALVEISVIAGR